MFLNGVEIWRIGRQKDEFVSAFLKDRPGFLSFVKGGIVHDDQGAGLKLLQELFLEVVVKNGGVQAPLKKGPQGTGRAFFPCGLRPDLRDDMVLGICYYRHSLVNKDPWRSHEHLLPELCLIHRPWKRHCIRLH